jgi:hypothetical protein
LREGAERGGDPFVGPLALVGVGIGVAALLYGAIQRRRKA